MYILPSFFRFFVFFVLASFTLQLRATAAAAGSFVEPSRNCRWKNVLRVFLLGDLVGGKTTGSGASPRLCLCLCGNVN